MLVYKRVERLSTPDDTILDVGAKGGSNLTGTEATVVAVDIEFSRSTNDSGVEYLYGDGRMLPFDDGVFDYVVLNQVIEHVDGRESLFREVKRVLKTGGAALFSFPNRLTFNKPHGLPRFLSLLPKPIGLRVGRLFLEETQYEYYRDALFPLSPVGARLELRKQFDSVRYVTVEESVASKEIYGHRRAPRLFVAALPFIALLTQFVVFRFLFELVWGYVSYECRKS